jgi:hypothetical protein
MKNKSRRIFIIHSWRKLHEVKAAAATIIWNLWFLKSIVDFEYTQYSNHKKSLLPLITIVSPLQYRRRCRWRWVYGLDEWWWFQLHCLNFIFFLFSRYVHDIHAWANNSSNTYWFKSDWCSIWNTFLSLQFPSEVPVTFHGINFDKNVRFNINSHQWCCDEKNKFFLKTSNWKICKLTEDARNFEE